MAIEAKGTSEKPQARQLTVIEQKFQNIRGLLAQNMKAIAAALPGHIKPERIARVTMNAIQKNPKLLECTQDSFLYCVLGAAALGLEPDGLLGQAYLVPFFDNKTKKLICTLIPGYRGLMKLGRQSGEIATIDAHEVCLGDAFDYRYGSDPMLKHRPAEAPIVEVEVDAGKPKVMMPDPDWMPGAITHFYAIAKMKDGSVQFVVMQKWEVNEIRNESAGYKNAIEKGWDHPWLSSYAEMGKKTAIRRGSKMWPASTDKDNLFQKFATMDDLQDHGIQADMRDIIDVELVTAPADVMPAQEGKRAPLDKKETPMPEPGSNG